MQKLQYGAATVSLSLDANRVATVDYRGPITPDVVSRARREYAAWALTQCPYAVVIRLDSTAGLFGIWPRPNDEQLLRDQCQMIGAYVVPEGYLGDVDHYCEVAAQFGAVRRAFSTYAPALAWATRLGLALRPSESLLARPQEPRPPFRVREVSSQT